MVVQRMFKHTLTHTNIVRHTTLYILNLILCVIDRLDLLKILYAYGCVCVSDRVLISCIEAMYGLSIACVVCAVDLNIIFLTFTYNTYIPTVRDGQT